ncbi:DEAD/DEAH box helicase family protein [Virgibacillus oceani]
MKNIEIKLQKALEENKRLKNENERLKEILTTNHIPFHHNTKEEQLKVRVQIFRNLFKGRGDVYAIQRKDKKVEYFPSEQKGSKPKKYYPLTDQVIYDHLSGKKTIGVYPVLIDNTCWFLAVDFDKQHWERDAKAFVEVCQSLRIPTGMERSRSGNGCHVWIFFETAIPASLARKLGYTLLSKVRETRGSLHSFDRMFPVQDTVPEEKLGNLIALPLQHDPRQQNNSVFVDENFNAYSNQWQYLSQIKKMSEVEVKEIIKEPGETEFATQVNERAASQTKIPKKLEISIKNGIHIPTTDLPINFLKQIANLGKFNNPKYYQARAKRHSTYNIPKVIDCTDSHEDDLIIPRGCFADLNRLFKENNVELIVNNETNTGIKVEREFLGRLTTQQEDAVNTLLYYKNGILSAATGFGKTVVAAALISKRNVNTLIIVHTKQLLDQWKESMTSFLDIEHADIGQVGGGKNTAKGLIDIATIQSLNYKGQVKDIVNNYGQIIVDECHHISAISFERVLKQAEAAYVHGLTATPTRRDKWHPIMLMQCGPIRYKVSAKDQAKVRPFKHILVSRKTSFKSKLNDKTKNVQNVYTELATDSKRNEMIFNDVLKELDNGSSPIILTERIDHVHELERMFENFAKNIIVLTGELKKKERKVRLQRLKDIPDEEERLIIATGKYIGEGFDNAVLDTLFLAMPISWKGTLQQYVGRLHRMHENKEIVKVYDYIDHQEEIFGNMFENRKKGYKALGYMVEGDKSEKASNEQMKLF